MTVKRRMSSERARNTSWGRKGGGRSEDGEEDVEGEEDEDGEEDGEEKEGEKGVVTPSFLVKPPSHTSRFILSIISYSSITTISSSNSGRENAYPVSSCKSPLLINNRNARNAKKIC
jgi:hypothetical protein